MYYLKKEHFPLFPVWRVFDDLCGGSRRGDRRDQMGGDTSSPITENLKKKKKKKFAFGGERPLRRES